MIFSKRIPRRLALLHDSGRVVDQRPDFSWEVNFPPECGHVERPARSIQIALRGNSIKVYDKATLLPGGIILHDGGLEKSSFRLEKYSDSTRFIRRRVSEGDIQYVLPKDWLQPEKVNEEAVFFDGEYIEEYGHFLLETLSRLWPLVEDSSFSRLPVVTSLKKTDWINFFYRKLGFDPPRIIALDTAMVIRKLWVFSQSFVLEKGFTPEARALYSRIGTKSQDRPAQELKVYITRRSLQTSTGRELENEELVENLFSRKGFTVLKPQDLSLDDQLSLFSTTSHLAGQTGTGMFNRIFQPEGSRGILMGPSDYILDEHAYLRSMMGLPEELVINGRSLEPEKPPQAANWALDIDALEKQVLP